MDGDASDGPDQGQAEGANEWFRSIPPALIVIRAPSPGIKTEDVDLTLDDSDDDNVVQVKTERQEPQKRQFSMGEHDRERKRKRERLEDLGKRIRIEKSEEEAAQLERELGSGT